MMEEEAAEDLDDDDSVEVLLTILPPSPATKRRRDPDTSAQEQCPITPNLRLGASIRQTSPSPSSTPLGRSVLSSNQRQVPVEESSATFPVGGTLPLETTTTTSLTLQHPRYSHRTSAYLQSLAEICHAILGDARWRVGGTQQEPLLKWERGEDLSAVTALARRYLPPPSRCHRHRRRPVLDRTTTPCSCFLCKTSVGDDGSDQPSQSDSTMLPPSSTDGRHEEDHAASPGTNDASPSEDHDDDDDETKDETTSEDYDRALNLYARLYFRKGPWFRVDDLFKYYSSSRPSTNNTVQSAVDTAAVLQTTTTTPKVASPSKFFVPKKSATKRSPPMTSSQSSSSSSFPTIDSRYMDHDSIKMELQNVVILLQDLKQLYGMGLIRSFHSEGECGQTIGEIQTYGLLRQEEQQTVLARLGGGSSSKSHTSKSQALLLGETNKIWKQMCQQQSITAAPISASGADGKVARLPVAKHVDETLMASWANTILLRSSRVDYIPQGIFKKALVPIQTHLRHLLKEWWGCDQVRGMSIMCLRLREAPLLSLQRCCRLVLCATSGPGEMRGDSGTNAWKALPGEVPTGSTIKVFATQVVSPPRAPNWHNTMYPGRDFRFNLISCAFQKACIPLPVQDDSVQSLSEESLRQVQVFSSLDSFHLWEQSVIIRSTVDYLMETNDLILYNERKRAREQQDDTGQDVGTSGAFAESGITTGDDNAVSPMDFLNILQMTGRRHLLHKFASFICPTQDNDDSVRVTLERVEESVGELLSHQACTLRTDCERVLCVIGVMVTQLLRLRTEMTSNVDRRAAERPWLRHLWWEGCLGYLLWDIIPIFEQRGYYQLATTALEILLFGKVLPRSATCPTLPQALDTDDGSFLAQSYLSRRARGKGFDRLVIDYLHILRLKQKETSRVAENVKTRKFKGKKSVSPKSPTSNDLIGQLCNELLKATAPRGQISFCAARTLARRLKQPLATTLEGLLLYEVGELGHRYSNDGSPKKSKGEELEGRKQGNAATTMKYSDWRPITDNAVANAMFTDGKNAVGGRCSYVGFEDNEDSPAWNFRSLNVEELALEYYNTGRLPEVQEVNTVRGGWIGWHDEGGKLRTLFRILASCAVLGSDWGCMASDLDYIDNATIYLTPYQGAPFDLHVGAELGGPHDQSRRGLYQLRCQAIDTFLSRLLEMSPEQVSEIVYSSIHARWVFAKECCKADPTLALDIQQTRTLCAMAAGFGGKMLATLCRCLFFDYRHYSGGLPDLTLCRALYESDDSYPEEELVDLGTWIGEGFSADQQAEEDGKSATRMLEDQDEEFLGCSKVGDSGRRNGRLGVSAGTRGPGRKLADTMVKEQQQMPEPLVFHCNGRRIRVECMLVEVKSQNDRLDSRQEDWLNVLDKHGNVRVCKFTSTKHSDQTIPSQDQPLNS